MIIQFGTNTFTGSEAQLTYPIRYTKNFTKIVVLASGEVAPTGFAITLKAITVTTATLVKSTSPSGTRYRWITIGY